MKHIFEYLINRKLTAKDANKHRRRNRFICLELKCGKNPYEPDEVEEVAYDDTALSKYIDGDILYEILPDEKLSSKMPNTNKWNTALALIRDYIYRIHNKNIINDADLNGAFMLRLPNEGEIVKNEFFNIVDKRGGEGKINIAECYITFSESPKLKYIIMKLL